MVDINYTILVQLANFLVLIIILNALLLKPVMKHLSERDGKISSSHEEAKANADKAEAMLSDFERELTEARVNSNKAYSILQQEGIAEQRTSMTAARAEAQKFIDKAAADIEAEAARARQTLKAEMEKLPKEIAAKMLGRAI